MDVLESPVSPIDKAAESFRYYARSIYPGRSPLYVSLAIRVAEDSELLEIAARASEKYALPNLFFAAVHLLLLKGERHQLAAFYPSLNNNSKHYELAYPYFRNFVLEHENEIGEIIATRFVQTNEVGRCAILVPAFELVARQTGNSPLSVIEIGSSAGLTLIWDRYHYRYGTDLECGDPNSPVQIECLLRGSNRPPIPNSLPTIGLRLGIDLNPIALNDPENIHWLQALVWPDHQTRTTQLGRAIQVAKQAPPQIMRGDALELLPSLIDRIEKDPTLCIYHSFTLSLATGKPKERLENLLTKESKKRDLFHISLEWANQSDAALLSLSSLTDGQNTEKVLARCSPHGEWLDWLGRSA